MQLCEVPGDEEIEELDQHAVQLVDADLQLDELLVLHESLVQCSLQFLAALLLRQCIHVHQRGAGMGNDTAHNASLRCCQRSRYSANT
ncbi:hypothetical protein D9M71_760350 [compost metagenome]